MYFYSPSTKGFYVEGQAIPPDVIEVSAEEHSALMSSQSAGFVIVFEDGKLGVKSVLETLSDAQKREAIKQSAAHKLAETDWSQFPDVEDNLANKDAFVQYRAKLRARIISPENLEESLPEKPKAKWRR